MRCSTKPWYVSKEQPLSISAKAMTEPSRPHQSSDRCLHTCISLPPVCFSKLKGAIARRKGFHCSRNQEALEVHWRMAMQHVIDGS